MSEDKKQQTPEEIRKRLQDAFRVFFETATPGHAARVIDNFMEDLDAYIKASQKNPPRSIAMDLDDLEKAGFITKEDLAAEVEKQLNAALEKLTETPAAPEPAKGKKEK